MTQRQNYVVTFLIGNVRFFMPLTTKYAKTSSKHTNIAQQPSAISANHQASEIALFKLT